MNPKILAERISNRNSAQHHYKLLNDIVTAEPNMYGHIYYPYLLSIDFDGALENAALLAWPADPDKPIKKIAYVNCVLLVLIGISQNNNSLVVCQENFATLQKIQPTLIVTCKTHIIRAGNLWSTSLKRSTEHRHFQNQFTRTLMHVLCYGSQYWDIVELNIQLGILIYILSAETIDCDHFTNASMVKEKSCHNRCVITQSLFHSILALLRLIYVTKLALL